MSERSGAVQLRLYCLHGWNQHLRFIHPARHSCHRKADTQSTQQAEHLAHGHQASTSIERLSTVMAGKDGSLIDDVVLPAMPNDDRGPLLAISQGLAQLRSNRAAIVSGLPLR